MKVSITQLEVQYYQITKEIELTKKEYTQYLKNGIIPQVIKNDLCSETGIEHWVETNVLSTHIN